MKITLTLALLLQFTFSYSQWTREEQLPASDIFSLYHNDSVLYAGGINIIYFSSDKGQTWDSTSHIPQLITVDNIIVFKNEIFASSFGRGVYKSPDGGATWQNINAGIPPIIADFCEWKGDLYVATLGSAVFELNPLTRNSWLSFTNGLSNLSFNLMAIAATNNTLIAGSLANGLYDYLDGNSNTWQERFLLNQISPSERIDDIVTTHDSLFLAGSTGRFYVSTDAGFTWSRFGNRLNTQFSLLANAKEALLTATNVFDGQNNHTFFSYIKKDSLAGPFVQFSFVPNHFTYRLEVFGDKVWNAGSDGLFYMPLSNLPGISATDSTPIVLPVSFAFFNVTCESDKTKLTWQTSQEQNTSHFNIEKSDNGIRWTVIGSLPAAGNSNTAKTYSFNDNNPVANTYYRVALYDADGSAHYTSISRSTCNTASEFSVAPNPFHDNIIVSIATNHVSELVIRLFDNKGALVKMQKAALLAGTNKVRVDIPAIANGVYTLAAEWDGGKMKKGVQVLKE
jgi:hypothetical protein